MTERGQTAWQDPLSVFDRVTSRASSYNRSSAAARARRQLWPSSEPSTGWLCTSDECPVAVLHLSPVRRPMTDSVRIDFVRTFIKFAGKRPIGKIRPSISPNL